MLYTYMNILCVYWVSHTHTYVCMHVHCMVVHRDSRERERERWANMHVLYAVLICTNSFVTDHVLSNSASNIKLLISRLIHTFILPEHSNSLKILQFGINRITRPKLWS